MDSIKVLDKTFERFIPEAQIQETIARIASEINRDLAGKDPLFLAILNGSFMFAGDLFQKITIPCRISFVKMASYLGTGSTGQVHQLIGLQESVAGRNIVILEDIIDTGLTIFKLLEHLETLKPAEIRIVTLLYKPDAFKADFPIDYVGIKIPNKFVVGYGLDYNGYGRNYPEIYRLKE